MFKTGIFTHASGLQHDTDPGHPERSERLSGVWRALRGLEGLIWQENPPAASRVQLERVHTPALIDLIASADAGMIDEDTVVSAHSYEAALHAAGAACAAVDAVMAGAIDNAFCPVRPPGHHAEPDRAMGFCLFNNVAVAARHAQHAHGLNRVAVLDFDLHHGNGTQAAAWNDPGFFFASSHEWPQYPGSGAASERGGHNNIINVPLPAGCGSAGFRAAWNDRIFPALEAFGPEFLFVSAGFDAHVADPLGNLELDAADFGWITREIRGLAARSCRGRLVSCLEGGYNLAALADSARTHVEALNEPE